MGVEPFGFSPSGMEVQKHFVIPSPTWVNGEHVGFGFQGYMDLWIPEAVPFPNVKDFKTCGSWDWIKNNRLDGNKDSLAKNVQAQLYATAAMYETGARTVDLDWVYMKTKGSRESRRVHLRVHADEVLKEFEGINDVALRMYEARNTVTDPLELESNTAICRKFGGCPHQADCNLSPGQKLESALFSRHKELPIMSNSVIEEMRKRKAALAGQAPIPGVGGASGYELSPQQLDGQAAADKGVAAIGINPPEQALPPAPPVGSVPIPPPAAKAGPGRPRGSKAEERTYDASGTATVTVVWAQETVAPIPYNTFVVGPFSVTGPVQPGESLADAQARLYAPLAVFAEGVRTAKAISFKGFIDAIGTSR